MGSDSFEWSTDVDNGTRRRKTLLAMQDNRRIPVCRQHIGANDNQYRVANVRL